MPKAILTIWLQDCLISATLLFPLIQSFSKLCYFNRTLFLLPPLNATQKSNMRQRSCSSEVGVSGWGGGIPAPLLLPHTVLTPRDTSKAPLAFLEHSREVSVSLCLSLPTENARAIQLKGGGKQASRSKALSASSLFKQTCISSHGF